MKETYCIDTSFLISCWNDYYREVFFDEENFFQLLVKKSKEYNFYIHQQVYFEINQKTDKLSQWLNKNKDCFFKINEEKEVKIANIGTEIIQKYTLLSKPNGADHFVIASAKALNATVVSDEKKGKMPTNRVKSKTIPAVCENENVDYDDVFDFIEKITIKFN